MDLIIKGGHCVLPSEDGQLATMKADIGIENGQIVEVGDLSSKEATKVFVADGLHVLPGLIDTQVHFREPGFEYKETIAAGTRGALQGGITGVFEMPNTKPATDTALALKDKISRAEAAAWSHYAFYLGATVENAEKLGEIENIPGCCGIKVFMGSSTGDLLVKDIDVLERVLKNGQRRVAVHCEDEKRLVERKKIVEESPGDVRLHPEWRDVQTAVIATQNLLGLSEKTKRSVHVLHVTTKDEMQILKEQKKNAGGRITVECTPQHLTLFAPDCYDEIGTLAQMNPPIRSKEHQEALWQALTDGVVDVLGSDHAPHCLDEKGREYPNTPSGMTGVQTTVPIMLNHIHEGRLSLHRLVELMAVNPCRIFGIKNKGAIRVGNDADFTVVDLKAQKVITNSWIESRSGWTPFHGKKVTGWPVATILNGEVAMRDGEAIGSPKGKAFQFDCAEL